MSAPGPADPPESGVELAWEPEPDELYRVAEMLCHTGRPEEAEAHFRQAAEAGHPGAMRRLGVLLVRDGDRVEEAERWLSRAADAGLPEAMVDLGIACHGAGDDAGTQRWLRAAAETGDPRGMGLLGFLLRGNGEADEGERWIRAAAEAGDPAAMCHLGEEHEETDPAEAFRWYQAAAEAGDPDGMFGLGRRLHLSGELRQAEQWLRRAVRQEHMPAAGYLGALLGEQGRATEAERLLRRAAESGDAVAAANLGTTLSQLERYEDAEPYLRQAAEGGMAAAMGNLAYTLYELDRPVESGDWWRRGAELGHPWSVVAYGSLLEDCGHSGEAERLYRLVAEAGEPQAYGALARLLERSGRTVESQRWRQPPEERHVVDVEAVDVGTIDPAAVRAVEAMLMSQAFGPEFGVRTGGSREPAEWSADAVYPVLEPPDWQQTKVLTDEDGSETGLMAAGRPVVVNDRRVAWLAYGRAYTDPTGEAVALRLVLDEDCEDEQALLTEAMDNLTTLPLEWERYGEVPQEADTEPFEILRCTGNVFAASKTFDRDFLRRAQRRLGCDRLVVGIPHSDVLLVARADLTQAQLWLFAVVVAGAYLEERPGWVTHQVLHATDGDVDGFYSGSDDALERLEAASYPEADEDGSVAWG